MKDAGRHRPEAPALDGLARRQRERAERSAVKRSEKRDDVRPARVILASLIAASTASVPEFEKNVRARPPTGAISCNRFAERHLRLVIVVGGDVQEPLRLLRNGPDDIRMANAGGVDRDARAAVEIDVAVDIFHDGALALAITNGALRGYDGTRPASRSSTALARGPGGGILIWGTS